MRVNGAVRSCTPVFSAFPASPAPRPHNQTMRSPALRMQFHTKRTIRRAVYSPQKPTLYKNCPSTAVSGCRLARSIQGPAFCRIFCLIASHLPGPFPGEGEPVCCSCWLVFSSVSGVFSKIASLTALLPCFYTSPIIARKGSKGQGFGSFFHTPFKRILIYWGKSPLAAGARRSTESRNGNGFRWIYRWSPHRRSPALAPRSARPAPPDCWHERTGSGNRFRG